MPYNGIAVGGLRFKLILAQIEAGNVWLPNDKAWVGDFIEECTAFPNSKYKDMVDTMTQALTRLEKRNIMKTKPISLERISPILV